MCCPRAPFARPQVKVTLERVVPQPVALALESAGGALVEIDGNGARARSCGPGCRRRQRAAGVGAAAAGSHLLPARRHGHAGRAASALSPARPPACRMRHAPAVTQLLNTTGLRSAFEVYTGTKEYMCVFPS